MQRLDVGKNFFSIRTVKQELPRETVQFLSLNILRSQVDEILSNMI